ncbi:MAG: insulinase family protein [Paludibacteraceae bacterium]|nr:insulinase family protein [Paludibacteraceae bacterium]
MKKLLILVCAVVMTASVFAQDRTGFNTPYQLPNGLTVLLWEDHDLDDVEGYVVVRAGAIDEPAECTGLAHYLEHMLFKGTQRIGAIDWEKERPHYENIIALYDELAKLTDKETVQRDTIIARINRESLEAAKYSTTEDFFNLLDQMGATDVNAYTSYDMTCYHNHFAGYQMQKWLTIFSDRLINPVFRTFQAELENVYEEYNMYEDNVQTQVQNQLFAQLYKGHPYERSVIGLPEHLKSPQLSKLIEFYNTWYVPNNMALIIVGDFDAEAAKPMIAETFGRLQSKELPARKQYPDATFQAGKKFNFKLGYYPQLCWAFDGVSVTDEDVLALQFVCSLLSNGTETGLLDKITLDGIVSYAGCSMDARRDMGRILISAMPYYDMNQQSYESNAATEKIVMREIDKIKNGEIDDWLINTVKAEYAKSYALSFEEGAAKMSALVQSFAYNQNVEDIFTENARIQALTKEDLQRIAKKYFDAPHMTFSFDEGEKKVNKLAKPKIKPLDMPKGVETEYAKMFKAIPSGEVKQTYVDFADVTIDNLSNRVKLHYSTNAKNNIFSMTLRYGIGTAKRPMLEYVASMMNVAGMKDLDGICDAQAFRRKMAELGGQVSYGVSDSYFTVSILGNEQNLEQIVKLVMKQMYSPNFDQRQFESMQGSEMSNRLRLSRVDNIQASAMREYLIFGEKSQFIDVVPFEDIYRLDLPKLLTELGAATKYAMDIYYCGQRPVAEVKSALAATVQQDMVASTSPEFRDRKAYNKTQIYLLQNSNVQQATVYFYFEGVPYQLDQSVLFSAFNQYFGGGFTGLVLDEIRTKRSMAYTASGYMSEGARPGRNSAFMGYIGTQNDKVVDAIETFMGLLDTMPQHPERVETIKRILLQEAQISKPGMRNKAAVYDYWQEMGYTDDPARSEVPAINALTWEQIYGFYQQYIQGKPVTIMVMGDINKADMKKLQSKFGKIQKVNKGKIFTQPDLSFLY